MKQMLNNMLTMGQLSAGDAEAVIAELPGLEGANGDCEAMVLQWLAKRYGVPYCDLTEISPEPRLLAQFPARVLLRYELLPLQQRNGAVEMATSRLFDSQGFDTLRMLTGQRLLPVLAPSDTIRREIKKRLGVGADTLDTLEEESLLQVVDEEARAGVDLDESAQDASIIRFVNQILSDAIAQRSTDVHLEPFEDEFRLRYRVDGVLQEVPVPTQMKRFQPAIVSRLKILSSLDIAEKRLPQDGRIKLRVNRAEVDVRVSVIPMIHGEAVVLRLLRQDQTMHGLGELQMDERELHLFRQALNMPHGIVLVTGPTGSGKTTTLYAALQEINDAERKIITIEDPVEYQIKGINQIQVSEKATLTFARGLRSILRHDPDVILVGEIRDAETARIAVQASLTGHLVFSTLHTNDSPSAITRLVDMGVEPYLVASSVEIVLAQRLVRVLCPECKQLMTAHERAQVPPIPSLGDAPLYRATGCGKCRNTGFFGRRAVFELMDLDEDVHQIILHSGSAGQIREAVRKRGWRALSEDGWRVVREGDTTVEEVLRVTKDATGDSARATASVVEKTGTGGQ